ncbi:hypothetical protein WISP_94597 [Willisornis vidua]|uniref:Uncharacterized protein n=1 Tax=Willisornis vidua TaxID=1566151 RepID=A0ABQ9D0K6_9PASS|nr:hypothetical protein WISP_94597 [Willisornis vidua]
MLIFSRYQKGQRIVDIMSEVEVGGHLGNSNHEGIKFKISVDRRKSSSKTSTLDMRRADFRLLRELAAVNPLINQPVSMFRIVLTKLQDHIQLHEIWMKPVKIPLDDMPSLQCVNYTTELGVITSLGKIDDISRSSFVH